MSARTTMIPATIPKRVSFGSELNLNEKQMILDNTTAASILKGLMQIAYLSEITKYFV